jgi:hypothetical protein
MIEYISNYSSIKINSVQIGKELKFLGYQRAVKYINGNNRYGYFILKNKIIAKQTTYLHNSTTEKK